ncbi:MAG: Type 1 glutamine amidotransferase-like domain-containing protein [Eubacterium sp.]|nr:Type 1 glutamine amidotransferase-like domain-containing protein [Eubacterium sp.]
MNRKIVAIGGGENGRQRFDGTFWPYETEMIDREIIALTGKDKPNFLLIAHSQMHENFEERYFVTMKRIYGEMFGCECRWLKKSELKTDFQKAIADVQWTDIIYEGGGDTKGMIELWRETGFDKVLCEAWQAGKVMCGVSAGANCWFRSCSSDSLKIQLDDDRAPMITVDCLNFIPAFFTPHCNVKSKYCNRLKHMKQSLKGSDLAGIAISNCAAIEIIDDQYRLITGMPADKKFKPYGMTAKWKCLRYVKEYLPNDGKYRKLAELFGEKRK